MNIICYGQQNWDYCWQAQHHIMSRLALRGHRVLYIDPQSSEDVETLPDKLRALCAGWSGFGLRQVGPRLFVYTHRHAPGLGWRLNQRLRPGIERRIARRLAFDDPVTIALHPSVAPALRPAGARARVYYALDEASAFGGMTETERRRVRASEEALLREVELALVVSPRLLARIGALQPRTYLLENGVDTEHFAPARLARATTDPALVGLGGTAKLAFVGQVDERLDQPLLVELARSRPDWQLVLTGRVKPGVDVSALSAMPNIHLLGYRPYAALPGVLREIDVCLVPYQLNELTQSCNALKVFEYLATGCPVVATPLEGIRACREVVTFARGAEGFRRAIEAALADSTAGRDDRLAVAQANTWEERVDELERHLARAVELARERHALPPTLRRPAPRTAWDARHFDQVRTASHGALPSLRSRTALALLRGGGWLYYAARLIVRAARRERPIGIRRILVARCARLGDLVVFLPTLRALRQLYPHAVIVLGVQPGMSAGSVLGRSSDVDEVRELVDFASSSRRRQLAGVIRTFSEGFDLVVSGATYFLLPEAFYTGAPYQIGLDDGHPLQSLNRRVLPLDPTRHEADNNLALVEALGGAVRGEERIPGVELNGATTAHDSDLDAGATLLSGIGLPKAAPVVTMHPGAQKPSRRWPPDRFADLAADLLRRRPDLWVVLSGLSEEARLIESIRGRIPAELRQRVLSVAGRTDLASLLGVLRRSSAFVCSDTGVMHLARAAGAPLVALLGPENDRRWGPHPGGKGRAIALRNEVPCAPCMRWECAAHYCLRTLSAAAVANAVLRLIDVPRTDRADGEAEILEQGFQRMPWPAIGEAGFSLPLVSIVLFTNAALGVEEETAPGTEADGVSQPLREALHSIDRQSYPALEVILVEPLPAATGERLLRERHSHALPIELARPARVRASSVWDAAVLASRGSIIAPISPGERWPVERIGADVAALVRDPAATASLSFDADAGRRRRKHRPSPLPAFRREALITLLERARLTRTGRTKGAVALWPHLLRVSPIARAEAVLDQPA